MRINNYAQKKVNEVLEQLPEARSVFYAHGISVTNRLSLANAAAATSVSPDELMAIAEYRTRRAAQRQQQQPVEALQEAELAI